MSAFTASVSLSAVTSGTRGSLSPATTRSTRLPSASVEPASGFCASTRPVSMLEGSRVISPTCRPCRSSVVVASWMVKPSTLAAVTEVGASSDERPVTSQVSPPASSATTTVIAIQIGVDSALPCAAVLAPGVDAGGCGVVIR